jgi:hypothetical protein
MKSSAFALIIGFSMLWARVSQAPPWTAED